MGNIAQNLLNWNQGKLNVQNGWWYAQSLQDQILILGVQQPSRWFSSVYTVNKLIVVSRAKIFSLHNRYSKPQQTPTASDRNFHTTYTKSNYNWQYISLNFDHSDQKSVHYIGVLLYCNIFAVQKPENILNETLPPGTDWVQKHHRREVEQGGHHFHLQTPYLDRLLLRRPHLLQTCLGSPCSFSTGALPYPRRPFCSK